MTAGTRAYSVGFQDGRFYANGWHITGEMGGIWAPPLKLADGVWFGVDDQWVGAGDEVHAAGAATRATTCRRPRGLSLRRTDFVPDGRRAALYGLELGNAGQRAAKTVTVKVDVALRAAGRLPVGLDESSRTRRDNLADTGGLRERRARLHRQGHAAGRRAARLRDAGRLRPPAERRARPARATGARSPARRCAADDSTSLPSACDDGPFGNGAGGQLRYRVTVKPRERETVWIARRRLGQGPGRGAPRARRRAARPRRPAGRRRPRSRAELARALTGRPPRRPPAAGGGRLGQAEHRRPHADRDRPQDPLRRPGQAVPAAGHDAARAPRSSAPATRTTRGCSPPTASTRRSRRSRVGQFEAIKEHLLALRDISDALNAR